MKTLQIFENIALGAKVRTIVEDSQVLFCASDVAKALGYTNPAKAIGDHCEGVTKRYTPTDGGSEQEMNYILEPDLYRLIFGSKLEGAKKFQDWIFSDVLPSIRKNGTYTAIDDIQQEVDMIRSVSDAVGIGDQGRLLAMHYGKVPLSKGQSELAQDLISKSDLAIKRSAMEIMLPRKEELILQLENKIESNTIATMTITQIRDAVNKRASTAQVAYALKYYGYADYVASNGKTDYMYPTVKGLEYCKPTTLNTKANKGLEIAKNWQFTGDLKKELTNYLMGII